MKFFISYFVRTQIQTSRERNRKLYYHSGWKIIVTDSFAYSQRGKNVRKISKRNDKLNSFCTPSVFHVLLDDIYNY